MFVQAANHNADAIVKTEFIEILLNMAASISFKVLMTSNALMISFPERL